MRRAPRIASCGLSTGASTGLRAGPFNPPNRIPETRIRELNRIALERSAEFFDYQPPRDFRVEHGWLRFTSAVDTPYRENNTVHARYFPASPRFKRGPKPWSCCRTGTPARSSTWRFARRSRRLGISALRISLPYHDRRMPPELTRADYAVSANIGRTIDATRQAVIDVRSCYDWLQQRGYTDLGIVGTSLGSCYAFLATSHDPRIRVNVFNHCSTYFADVVWTGLSTRHIRKGIEDQIDVDRLRAAWDCISPVHYMDRFASR